MKAQIVFLGSVMLCGCAKPATVHYLPAEPEADSEPKPAIIEVARPMPLPGQMKPMPELGEADDDSVSAQKPWSVIAKANSQASRQPDTMRYFNAMMTFDFAPGALYQIYTAPLRLTDMVLQPGETLMGQPACGDTVRWVMALGTSKDNGQERQHIYLKPTVHGLNTTLTVTTNRRVYHFELHSYKKTYMASVSFRYPQDELTAISKSVANERKHEANTTATAVRLEQLHFNYDITVEDGDADSFKPVQVFDDGRKTFIQFPKTMQHREAPTLFVLSKKGETQIVNYRKKNDFYIVDRLFNRAELRLGQKDPDVVRIGRLP